MANRDKLVRDIKTGGSIGIYVGTASIIKPFIKKHNQERNAFSRVCSILSGTVISCGISSMASKWFESAVDKVADFIDDIKGSKPKVKESDSNG